MLGAWKRMWGSVSGTRSCWGQMVPLEQSGYCPQYFLISRSPRCASTLGIGLEGVTFAWPPQLTSISVILAAGTQNTSPLKCSWRGRQGTPVGDTCSGPCQQRKNSMLLSWILEYPKCLSRQQSQHYSTHILPRCMNCTVIPPFSFIHKKIKQARHKV